MARRPRFVVVSGPPASGKSTLAAVLAERLGLPLVAKDTVKDALVAVLGAPDLESSRRLGGAAVVAMVAVAAESPVGAVLDSVFFRSRAASLLSGLPGDVVEVFCRCGHDVAARRFQERAASLRAGYFDHLRAPEELWNDEIAEPVAGGWPVIEVDTTASVDIDRLLVELAMN